MAVQRFRIQNLMFLTALVAFSFVWNAQSRTPETEPALIPAIKPEVAKYNFAYQGVGGCAAMACHHQNGPKGSPRSEYSTWIGADKHSQAYAVLFDEWAQTIDRNYRKLPDIGQAKAYENQYCLKCHVHPEIATAKFATGFSHNDGVGCENCHGPAENWISLHYRADWKGKPADEKAALGFRDLTDLTVRAQSCIPCHVGAPGMEVDHDLIAAGHPRLAFEFAGYHAIMPHHWKETGRNAKPDFEARAWAIGQLTTAKGALALLADRAARAGSTATAHKQPWPEFAEYDCYACHHDLKSKNRTASRPQTSRPVGTLPWGDWYFSNVNNVLLNPKSADFSELMTLRSTLEQPYPDPATVEKHAKSCAAKMDAALEIARNASFEKASFEETLQRILQSGLGNNGKSFSASTNWDSATQTYLALAAIHQAMHETNKATSPELKQAIEQFGKFLDHSFPTLKRGRATSPSDFDYEKAKAQLEAIERQKGAR